MPCAIQRATVPGKWLRPKHVRYIPRPTGSVLFTQEILDLSVHYPVLYHHLESSPYPKAGPICHARFKELLYQRKWLRSNHIQYIPRPTGSVLSTQEILDPSVHYPVLYHHLESSPCPKAGLICHARYKELLYQKNGCVPITYGTFWNPQGLSYPHKKYWTHRSIIQYYTITLNRVLTQRQVSYAMHDSKSYCTEKMPASQSRMVHSKTRRVCPIHTNNIGPIGPLSSTIPSPWIESIPKGRSHMPCPIQRATVPGKWLRPNHVWYIPRPTGSVLSTQKILDPSVHYPVLYHHLELSPYPKAGLTWHARFKELLYQEMAGSQSRTVHSKTHRVCTIHTRNIGPIGPLSSTITSPWIESLPKGRSQMPCAIQRATVPGKWLCLNQLWYIQTPTGSVLSTQ